MVGGKKNANRIFRFKWYRSGPEICIVQSAFLPSIFLDLEKLKHRRESEILEYQPDIARLALF